MFVNLFKLIAAAISYALFSKQFHFNSALVLLNDGGGDQDATGSRDYFPIVVKSFPLDDVHIFSHQDTNNAPNSTNFAFIIESIDASMRYESPLSKTATLSVNFRVKSDNEIDISSQPSSTSNILSNSSNIGLYYQNSWTYVRLYAQMSNTKSELLRDRSNNIMYWTMASASVVAEWVVDRRNGRMFRMNITLALGSEYNLYLLRSFDNCPLPLEDLSDDDFYNLRFSAAKLGNAVLTTKVNRVKDETTFDQESIIASFKVTVKALPSSKTPTTKFHCRSSNYDNVSNIGEQGVWINKQWVRETPCISTSPSNGDTTGTQVKTVNTVQKGIYYKQLCVVGDSHIVRMVNYEDLDFRLKWLVGGGGKFSHKFNYHVNRDIHKVIHKTAWETESASLFQSLQRCLSAMKKYGTTMNEGPGILLWWIGSHALFLSQLEVGKVVSDLISEIQPHLEPKQCVIIVGSLDINYAAIELRNADTIKRIGGDKTETIKFYQNSFRSAASNKAMEKAVHEYSRLLNVHYVDLFTPSLPLHFEGHDHNNSDAIHFSLASNFYNFAIEELIKTASLKCS